MNETTVPAFEVRMTATRVRWRGAGPAITCLHEGWTADGPDAVVEHEIHRYATARAAKAGAGRFVNAWKDGRGVAACGADVTRTYPDGVSVRDIVVISALSLYGHRDHYAIRTLTLPLHAAAR